MYLLVERDYTGFEKHSTSVCMCVLSECGVNSDTNFFTSATTGKIDCFVDGLLFFFFFDHITFDLIKSYMGLTSVSDSLVHAAAYHLRTSCKIITAPACVNGKTAWLNIYCGTLSIV